MSRMMTKGTREMGITILILLVLLCAASPAFAVTYTYDDGNRLIQEQDTNGLIIDYIYDDSGQLLRKQVSSASRFLLSVTKTGTGSGSVASTSPATPSISCGPACSASYNLSTSVTLNATADTGSSFTGWSGDCSGASASATVTMDRPKTCTATFTLSTYTVTASAANGTATPATQTVNYGATAGVSGTANANYYFTGASGCGGTAQSNTNQTVTTFSYMTGPVTANCTVTATYAPKTFTVTPSAGANGTMTPNTPQTVNYNGTTSFTVTPNTGYSIGSVTGCGGTLSGSTYTTGPIAANCTVSATFVAAPSVAALNAWTNVYSGAPKKTSATNLAAGTITVGSGTNRLLLVAVVMEVGTASNPTITAALGGTALTQIAVTATTQKEIVWMGYLKDSQIGSGAKALTVTFSGATGNATGLHVKWASFTGVNQTTPTVSSGATNTATTSATFGSVINYVANGMTTVVAGNGGSNATGTLSGFTAGTKVTSNGHTSNSFSTAKHTSAGSYASATAVSWTGTTSAWSGLVVVSLQP